MSEHYPEPILVEPKIFSDERGYFFEPYNRELLRREFGITADFVQDNESLSRYGVVRGLHYQIGAMAQAKLVRVVTGRVLDVAVDIRRSSPHFGKIYSYILDDQKKHLLFIPRGFAHGFAVLSEKAIFQYKVDNFYDKASERGIHHADPTLNIDWQIPPNQRIVSAKDQTLPFWPEAEFFD
ncbi:MAG: dTDP-4-dehydrorhamnose 3,5-epimerase [Leptospiraceae bacterium]|nr:dTDP-4-dehydrorhamnose 3,5-epimerase [Leptospiraceae bacterium]